MAYFVGLDVSVKETSVCIVDDAGKIVREVKVASEPEALLAVLKNLAYHFKRIGLEAGPLSQWLFSALAEAGLRCTGPLQELQGGRGGIWIDTCQVSVGRDRPNRRNITVWRRDDADDALRSGPEHAGAFDEMVLAQGLGDEDRQASRDEKGDRGAGTPAGRDPAPHLG